MGVIKKNSTKLGIFSSESEESLHVVQSSEDESSVSDSVTTATQYVNPIRYHRLPVPMCIISSRKNPGKKRYRRYENGHQLETLVENEELCAVSIHDFIPSSCGGFTKVLEDKDACEAWDDFVTSSEDQQQQIISHNNCLLTKLITSTVPQTPEDAFKNIKTGLRNTLKRSHVPLGIIENLETKVVDFFTITPFEIFISEHLSSFERLLLHAVAQYYCLRSQSFDSESGNVRLVKVRNPYKSFYQPPMHLVEYLIERRKHLNQQD